MLLIVPILPLVIVASSYFLTAYGPESLPDALTGHGLMMILGNVPTTSENPSQ